MTDGCLNGVRSTPANFSRAGRSCLWPVVVIACLGALDHRADAVPVSQDARRVLTVVVLDQTDAAIVGARVTVGDRRGTGLPAVGEQVTNGRGEAAFEALAGDKVAIRVEFEGFEPHVASAVTLRRRATVYRVQLRVASYVENVTVQRDPRDVQTDRRGDAFATVLTPEQLSQLSDDPETLARELAEMAGPGAVTRVDGFRGGRFPSKHEISRIRIVWNVFSAEFHEGGVPMVDVTTKPGQERYHGSFGASIQPPAFAASSRLAHDSPAQDVRRFLVALSGPIRGDRSSFQVLAQGSRRDDVLPVVSALPSNPEAASPVRTTRQLDFIGRAGTALPMGWSLRAAVDLRRSTADNLGVGALDLPERAYARNGSTTSGSLSTAGAFGARAFLEARARLVGTDFEYDPAIRFPALIVAGAGARGGAQVEGGRTGREVEVAADLDIPWRQHGFRLGLLLEHQSGRGDEWLNKQGTYYFSSLDDVDQSTPNRFTVRVGDPVVQAHTTQFGMYVQDDVRLRKGLSASVGFRAEVQRALGGGWNAAPRAGLAWSPFPDGRTTLNVAAGVYYSWVGLSNLEDVARLDGTHQQEIMVLPPFDATADPGPPGSAVPNVQQLSPSLQLPRAVQWAASVQHTVVAGVTLRASYEGAQGERLFRGHNLNPLKTGAGRPDPEFGNIVQMESTARSRSHGLRASLIGRIPRTSLTIISSYVLAHMWNDTDGPFDLPADPGNLGGEWGPSSTDVRHRFSASAILSSRSGLSLVSSVSASSALPYTIITGYDDNGDSIFNDRPAGVGRNTARQAAQYNVSGRVSWTTPLRHASRATPQHEETREGSRGESIPVGPKLRISLDVFNLFNTQNSYGYVGVVASPLLGQPTSATAPRRVECGFTISF